jgi:biofilm PGA synthesis protein PgaA
MHSKPLAAPRHACALLLFRKLTVSVALALPALLSPGVHAGDASATMSDTQAMLAQAQADHMAGRRMDALARCQAILARSPGDVNAERLMVTLLGEMGASARALSLAGSLNGSLGTPTDQAELLGLRADMGAHKARWAEAAPADLTMPYLESDQAVGYLDSVIAAAHPDHPEIARRARIDRLVALDDAGRKREAVQAWRELMQDGVSLPPYAERSAADALLGQRQPAEAARLYEDSIAREPHPTDFGETDPRISLIYAYYDQGEYRKALAMSDQLSAEEQPWIRAPGGATRIENQRKENADLNAALLREYAGMLENAWGRLAGLSAQAPANAELRRELGLAELARGWPRRAQGTLRIALDSDPNDVGARLGIIDTQRVLFNYAPVESELRAVEAVASRNQHVQEERGAWERDRGWQFDLSQANGKGSSPDFGDHDSETRATLASPLLDDHWRILGVTRLDWAALPEGHVESQRVGLGVRGYATGIEAYLQALPAIDRFVGKTAIESGFSWFASDHWTFSADGSTAGDDIPLRAQFYRITGKTLDVAGQWHASELTSAKLTLSGANFSDGNQRRGWLAAFIQRLHTAPNLTIDGGLELGGSKNSLVDRPYFNPARDRSVALTGRLENMLTQFYDRSLRQRIDVSFGSYEERGFGSGWMASARYGQVFNARPGLNFGWGLGWHNQPYDGRRESRVVLDLTMHWGD